VQLIAIKIFNRPAALQIIIIICRAVLYSCQWYSISQLWGVTCHMGSQRVTS